MGYDNCILRVCRLQNGFEVEIYEPPAKPKKSSDMGPYVDPWKEYAFSTEKEALKFITTKLGTLSRLAPGQEYDDAFDAAAAD